ncbi:MarR family transcriptional regulator [Aliifodinibius sp. S!AR15-10]|uniref:MarR family winged helix-turn-helix transcriptional regulator n=1 Tax=Aliifodinibius sp. S!AR15-10 TaxID=2950437 RepID=UPI00286006F3|nr:MarR family transcriptional regulator [Aliifodinibius sp. S!AR15-10]MDR8394028.1 MarR family transcriptional regulator [Aliifodinibius sp. S!AR15-10]
MKQKLYCITLGCKMAYSLKGIKRMLTKRFTKDEIALTLEQYFVLNILDNEEGLILKELAEIVDRDKSAVLRHIDGLEEKHFVARATDPKDKRRKILLVTKQGMNELQKAREMDQKVHSELTESIDNDKLKEFESLLTEIYERAMSD